MAYEAHSRQGRREPGYFESTDSHMHGYSSQYNVEPRENLNSSQRASSTLRQTNDNMTSAPDHIELSGADVSPELIAEITERVKRERTFIRLSGSKPRPRLT